MRFLCLSVFMGLLVAGCTVGSAPEVEIDEGEQAGEVAALRHTPERAPAFSQLWPTKFSRDDLINSAQSEMYLYFDAKIGTDCDRDLQIAVEDDFPGDEITRVGNLVRTTFCDDLRDDAWLVVGDYEFLREIVAQNRLRADEFGGVCGSETARSAGCSLRNTAWVGTIGVGREWVPGIAAHELFHVVQDSISPDPPSWNLPPDEPLRVPNWITEGSANFFEYSVSDYLGIRPYIDHEEQLCELQPGQRNTIDLRSHTDTLSYTTYFLGQFATEYLVANVGFEKFINIWRFRDRGVVFTEAFSESVGISVEEFYKITSQISLLSAQEGDREQQASDCEPEVQENNATRGPENDGTDSGWCGLGRVTHSDHWWDDCSEIPIRLGEEENSNHGYPTTFSDIPIIGDCSEIESIGLDIKGWAATFSARENTGASQAFVSTAQYAKNYLLDTNGDGVICSAQVPED